MKVENPAPPEFSQCKSLPRVPDGDIKLMLSSSYFVIWDLAMLQVQHNFLSKLNARRHGICALSIGVVSFSRGLGVARSGRRSERPCCCLRACLRL